MKNYAIHLLSILLIGFGFPAMIFAAPANDSFSTPTAIVGIPATATDSNIDATLQINEPLPDAPGSSTAQSSQASVWFTWTAPITGAVQIDTLGSDFDTIVAVWTGSNLATLSETGSNDEYGGSQSAVFIDVVMGATYRIAVYGFFDDRGSITLNIANDTTSRISGAITGPDGNTPLPGLYALAHRQVNQGQFAYWEALAYATTGVDGTYTIRGLSSDTYRVEFRDFDEGDFLPEYYDNAPDLDSAADIMVAPTTTVTAINASLALASKITGTVTGPDGITPLAGISVTAYRSDSTSPSSYWEPVEYASTQADGSYQLGGLAGGTYRIGFRVYGDESYIPEYYNNAVEVNSAIDITVASASTVTAINASLALASKITGTVTGPDGTTPLAGIGVAAYRLDSTSPSSYWKFVAYASTKADGSYQLGGLAGGTYRIGFSIHDGGDYIPEYYNNAADVNSAIDITVSSGSTISSINASLASASKISGTVTGPDGTTQLSGISAIAYRFNMSLNYWEGISAATTQGDGSYMLGGLTSGSYRVGFSDRSGDYLPEFYNNALTVNAALNITVPGATIVTGVSASLAASVSPTITGFRKTGLFGYEISFIGNVGQRYQLQEAVSLMGWADVGTPFTCLVGVNIRNVMSSSPQKFWRIRTLP